MKKSKKIKLIAVSIVILLPIILFFVFKLINPSNSLQTVLKSSGFSEVKPPSTLVPPGTWVSIIETNPLQLGVVCTPESSIGLNVNDLLLHSKSVDSKIKSTFGKKFDLNTELLSKVKNNSNFSLIENIQLKITNIRLVELSDDTIINGINTGRTDSCKQAIRFRIKQKTPITMIKSAYIADIYYEVDFKNELEAKTEAKIKKQLALELDLRISSSESEKVNIIGKNLIWGVREDLKLAKYGVTLPSTGGINSTSIGFTAGSTISNIIEPSRRKFTEVDAIVSYNVKPLRQSSNMSCWAAVYTMIKSWKTEQFSSVSHEISKLGEPWVDYYLKDIGLPGGEEKAFVSDSGMISKPPANYTIEAYLKMLTDHGPIWIITGDGISSHAKLLIGVYGNYEGESIKSYEETIFEFIDPSIGDYQYVKAIDFVNNFESEARWLVEKKLDDIEFRDQIILFPNL